MKLVVATIVSPLAIAAVVGLFVLLDAPANWGPLLAVSSAAVIFGIGMLIAIVVLVPAHWFTRHKPNVRPIHFAGLAGVISMLAYIAYNLFTGSFGPLHNIIPPSVVGLSLGWLFGLTVRGKHGS